MDVTNNTITITSFIEARQVAYAPIYHDGAMGSMLISSAASVAGIPHCNQKNYKVAFAHAAIRDYFNMLVEHEENHKLAYVDFENGFETESSWWGTDDNCIQRENWEDSRPADYLQVIRYVIRSGYDLFDFEFFEDITFPTEACKITKRKSNREFVIARIVDPNIYDGLVDYCNSQKLKSHQRNTASLAEMFINS